MSDTARKKNLLAKAFRQFNSGNLAAAKNALFELQTYSVLTSGVKHLEAKILQVNGKLSEAAKAYEAACNMADTHPNCFLDLADIMRRTGNKKQEREILIVAFRRFPQDAHIAAKLGLAMFDEGHVNQVRKLLEYALNTDGNNIDVRQAAGTFYRAIGQPDLAATHFKQALKVTGKTTGTKNTPRREKLSLLVAEAARDNRDILTAENTLRRVIRLNPKNTRAWLILSDIIRFTPNAPEITKMSSLLVDRKSILSAPDRIDLNFALGKAFIDSGQPKQAMEHLIPANRLRRDQLSYDIDAICRRLENYRTCFSPKIVQQRRASLQDQNESGPSPVFIVGMPRSGTTLIEQILATHEQVFGADELTTLPRLKRTIFGPDFPDVAGSIDWAMSKERLSLLAASYTNESRQYIDKPTNHYRYLIDKLPGNFVFSGLITMAMPNARIIHCRRNPIDTCLSCFSKYFVSGQSFSYDLSELGRYYRAYEQLMAHWHNVLPASNFIEIRYEDMIADTETEVRRLTNFLDLDWDPALLTFHENRRSVRTASANQVRKPIYSSSVERWKPYAPYIQPLLSALNK
ncbi:sulfotransferase [Thalassospira sp. GB04J01]|uniref:tetratricopeptide repeat-containing sulfotransferase family protein n=1 Tax=Thalassospira sp. GB04J01 TaxID=1485225 RepID=UPI000C9B9CF7|nr:sulfotransferase [Thalassospira sp. GB04J01]|tara:strand:- start:10501 stop:12225 length:1725 start_codon:yes stop_codon:yes gene_type:complete